MTDGEVASVFSSELTITSVARPELPIGGSSQPVHG